MAAARPDLYESLQIRYPPSPTQAPAPRSPPAAPRWVLGTVLAVGTGVILVLGATLAALITLYVQGQADLRAAQAELAALSSLLLPDGARSPSETPAAAQQRKEKLGNVPGGVTPTPGPPWPPPAGPAAPRLPSPQDSGCRGCPWAGGTTRARSTSSRAIGSPGDAAEAACRSTHARLTSITSPEEQDYLAREARGGTYWIGLVATGPGGSWRWVDGAAYSQAQSFWAAGQPDNTDYGQLGRETCAQIHPVGNGLWNDHNCNFTFSWICKRDLSPP
ncbi:C-type lectin domain family 4 member K isoform X1 [Phalacrocorax carbo]|uniref:C-type lectin domain family 4 member K isoform X1 n=1 Tax=Phalacrocorax carbo TaxID=9209 RepID=UPI00311A5766